MSKKRLPSDAFNYCPMGGRCSMKCRWSKPRPVSGGWADPPDCRLVEALERCARELTELQDLQNNLLNIVGAIRGER